MTNKLFPILITITISLMCCSPCAAQSRAIYEASRTTTPIKVDGKLDEPVWSKARQVELVSNSDGGPASQETKAALVYDDQFLYVAFRATDTNIWATYTRRDSHLWDEEVVEVFLQGDPKKPSYIELEVNPLGTMLDIYLLDVRKPLHYESWNSEKLRWAIQVDGTVDGKDGDRGWTTEIAVPLEDVVTAPHLPPQAGDRWRLNLYRMEQRPKPALMAWAPTLKDDFHVPSMFGELLFSGRQLP